MLSEAKVLFCFQVAHTAHFLGECFISTVFEKRRATQTLTLFVSGEQSKFKVLCSGERLMVEAQVSLEFLLLIKNVQDPVSLNTEDIK